MLVDPYGGASHARWMRGYQEFSQHTVQILSLEGQFWQWRMLGGAVTLAERFLQLEQMPDLVVGSDMLDVTTFLALVRPYYVPLVVYFHENQLNYPHGPRQKVRNHYAFINYVSALAAEAVVFNSEFHRAAFLDELPRLLKHFPDHNNLHTIDQLRDRSAVLPVGLNFSLYGQNHREPNDVPLILWNHRWDYDKNPQPFLKALMRLADAGYDFEVAITGENSRQKPIEFEAVRRQLGTRVVQFGYVEQFADYVDWLWQADVVVSTAIQDFFGISVVEAIYCGCWPILPKRLNYPALVPDDWHRQCLFVTDEGLYHHLRDYVDRRPSAPDSFRQHVLQFDWRELAPRYDRFFEGIINSF